MEKREINLEYLNAVKSNTKAFIEIKRTLDLTPAELNLLGMTQAPEEIYSTVVRLKWDYKSRINDVRKQMGMPPADHDILPWGEWEIPGAIIRHDFEGVTHRYLRYYTDPDPHDTDTFYFDPTTGAEITGLKRSDLERILRKRKRRRNNSPFVSMITGINNISELTTLDENDDPDIDIITTVEL